MLAATRQRFLEDYVKIRHAEGRGSQDSSYYLALPYRDVTGRLQDQWNIRGASYRYLENRVPAADRAALLRGRCASPISGQGTAGCRTVSRCADIVRSRSTSSAIRSTDSPPAATTSSGLRSRASTPSSTACRSRAPASISRSSTRRSTTRRTIAGHSPKSAAASVRDGQLPHRRFAGLSPPRARRSDAARAPPAVRGHLRLRLRLARQHRILRRANAGGTRPRPRHRVADLQALVRPAVGAASVEGALERQAAAVALLDPAGTGSRHDRSVPSAQHQAEEPAAAALGAASGRGARRPRRVRDRRWQRRSRPVGNHRRADADAARSNCWACRSCPARNCSRRSRSAARSARNTRACRSCGAATSRRSTQRPR